MVEFSPSNKYPAVKTWGECPPVEIILVPQPWGELLSVDELNTTYSTMDFAGVRLI